MHYLIYLILTCFFITIIITTAVSSASALYQGFSMVLSDLHVTLTNGAVIGSVVMHMGSVINFQLCSSVTSRTLSFPPPFASLPTSLTVLPENTAQINALNQILLLGSAFMGTWTQTSFRYTERKQAQQVWQDLRCPPESRPQTPDPQTRFTLKEQSCPGYSFNLQPQWCCQDRVGKWFFQIWLISWPEFNSWCHMQMPQQFIRVLKMRIFKKDFWEIWTQILCYWHWKVLR